MLRLRKLYTEPETISPIQFEDGVNLILGVEDDSSDKTNGVGKSLCIEFINFALLKQRSKSRVGRIPDNVFSKDTFICLDLEIDGQKYTVKRSLERSETPTLIGPDGIVEFSKIEDASTFLKEKLFKSDYIVVPSFRSIMGPLIRDERSEFKSLISCYDTDQRVPDDYSPHAYLLGLDVEIYRRVRSSISKIDELGKDIKKIRDNVRLLRGKEIPDARSDLNELEREVSEIDKSIDALENVTGYETIQDDIVILESRIDSLRREKFLLNQKLRKTKLITSEPSIDIEEVKAFFTQIDMRLGDLIRRDLDQVVEFKSRIDDFQNELIREQRGQLERRIEEINVRIAEMDRQYKSKLTVLDQSGALKNLKQTYSAFQSKADETSQLKAFITKFDELEVSKQKEKSEKEAQLLHLQSDILNLSHEIEFFKNTVLDIHEYVQGNRRASFEVKPTSKKQVLEITLRIDDDGSHSVEREKVFIYDLSLLLSEFTSKRHPGVLIHDNIFDVDQDTLLKNIKYLTSEAMFNRSQQYILTLNADRLDEDIRTKVEVFVRQKFTKQNRFLKSKYQEQQ